MRCKKCGFVLEEGQTFCNMCGAEQSKIKDRQKTAVGSFLGIIKFSSKNHRKMWLNLLIGIILLTYAIFFDIFNDVKAVDISAVAMLSLLILYIFVQIIMGYKNPEATYTKRYRYAIKVSLLLYILLTFYIFVINDSPFKLIEWFKDLINWRR